MNVRPHLDGDQGLDAQPKHSCNRRRWALLTATAIVAPYACLRGSGLSGSELVISSLTRYSSRDPLKGGYAADLTCSFPHQRIDPVCSRFVYVPIAYSGGLGNKFLTYALGLLLAADLKATYLFSNDSFVQQQRQDHDSYAWAEAVFGWGWQEQDYAEIVRKYDLDLVDADNMSWEEIVGAHGKKCNVIIHANDMICSDPTRDCYFADEPRVYERVKSIMRCKLMHSSLPPQRSRLRFSTRQYNIAWHIRTGDEVLEGLHADRKYFARVKKELDVVLEGFDYVVHFFAEAQGFDSRPPPGYRFLRLLFPDAHYHNDLSVQDTLIHMMNADMLITSGSSFCFIAACLSHKPTVLFEKPKEGDFFGVYMDANYIKLDDGQIKSQSRSEVRAAAMYNYRLYHDDVIPDSIKVRKYRG